MKICENLISHSQKVWSENIYRSVTSSKEYKKLHILIFLNFSTICFENKSYDKALGNCNTALKLCNSYNDSSYILDVLYIKIKIMYKIGEYEESKEIFNNLQTIMKYLKPNIYLLNQLSNLSKNYPKLF